MDLLSILENTGSVKITRRLDADSNEEGIAEEYRDYVSSHADNSHAPIKNQQTENIEYVSRNKAVKGLVPGDSSFAIYGDEDPEEKRKEYEGKGIEKTVLSDEPRENRLETTIYGDKDFLSDEEHKVYLEDIEKHEQSLKEEPMKNENEDGMKKSGQALIYGGGNYKDSIERQKYLNEKYQEYLNETKDKRSKDLKRSVKINDDRESTVDNHDAIYGDEDFRTKDHIEYRKEALVRQETVGSIENGEKVKWTDPRSSRRELSSLGYGTEDTIYGSEGEKDGYEKYSDNEAKNPEPDEGKGNRKLVWQDGVSEDREDHQRYEEARREYLEENSYIRDVKPRNYDGVRSGSPEIREPIYNGPDEEDPDGKKKNWFERAGESIVNEVENFKSQISNELGKAVVGSNRSYSDATFRTKRRTSLNLNSAMAGMFVPNPRMLDDQAPYVSKVADTALDVANAAGSITNSVDMLRASSPFVLTPYAQILYRNKAFDNFMTLWKRTASMLSGDVVGNMIGAVGETLKDEFKGALLGGDYDKPIMEKGYLPMPRTTENLPINTPLKYYIKHYGETSQKVEKDILENTKVGEYRQRYWSERDENLDRQMTKSGYKGVPEVLSPDYLYKLKYYRDHLDNYYTDFKQEEGDQQPFFRGYDDIKDLNARVDRYIDFQVAAPDHLVRDKKSGVIKNKKVYTNYYEVRTFESGGEVEEVFETYDDAKKYMEDTRHQELTDETLSVYFTQKDFEESVFDKKQMSVARMLLSDNSLAKTYKEGTDVFYSEDGIVYNVSKLTKIYSDLQAKTENKRYVVKRIKDEMKDEPWTEDRKGSLPEFMTADKKDLSRYSSIEEFSGQLSLGRGTSIDAGMYGQVTASLEPDYPHELMMTIVETDTFDVREWMKKYLAYYFYLDDRNDATSELSKIDPLYHRSIFECYYIIKIYLDRVEPNANSTIYKRNNEYEVHYLYAVPSIDLKILSDRSVRTYNITWSIIGRSDARLNNEDSDVTNDTAAKQVSNQGKELDEYMMRYQERLDEEAPLVEKRQKEREEARKRAEELNRAGEAIAAAGAP